MAPTNLYAKYANNKAMTAKGPELTLMLYDGAIKFCNRAQYLFEKDDVIEGRVYVMKVQRIIEYLRETLDMKYATAQDFDNIYSYLLDRIVQANTDVDVKILEEINGHLHSVRDTWVEVMKANGFTPMSARMAQ